MDATVATLIEKADDFLARDLLYFSAGVLFSATVAYCLDLVSWLALAELSDLPGIFLACIAVPIFFYCYAIAYCVREVLCLARVTATVSYFDVKSVPLDMRVLFPVLRGQTFEVAAAVAQRSSLSATVETLQQTAAGYGAARAVFRSIYLKEMCATLGSSAVASGAVLIWSGVSRTQEAQSAAGIALFGMGFILCRLAVYQSMRGTALVSDWQKAFDSAQKGSVG